MCLEVGQLALGEAIKMAELRLEPMPGCLQRLCLSLSFWVASQNENVPPLELLAIVTVSFYSLLINPVLPVAQWPQDIPNPRL